MNSTGVAATPCLTPGALAAAGDVVCLPDGLPGFPHCRRFVIVSSDDLAPLIGLQGLDEDRPSFLAIDPRLVLPAFEARLSAVARDRLDAAAGDPLLWLALVHVERDRVLVNLQAPVVINPARMLGIQLIDADGPYSTHHELLRG
jgi:flagellar assembly factor FliW